jgi:hypothetical protein
MQGEMKEFGRKRSQHNEGIVTELSVGPEENYEDVGMCNMTELLALL